MFTSLPPGVRRGDRSRVEVLWLDGSVVDGRVARRASQRAMRRVLRRCLAMPRLDRRRRQRRGSCPRRPAARSGSRRVRSRFCGASRVGAERAPRAGGVAPRLERRRIVQELTARLNSPGRVCVCVCVPTATFWGAARRSILRRGAVARRIRGWTMRGSACEPASDASNTSSLFCDASARSSPSTASGFLSSAPRRSQRQPSRSQSVLWCFSGRRGARAAGRRRRSRLERRRSSKRRTARLKPAGRVCVRVPRSTRRRTVVVGRSRRRRCWSRRRRARRRRRVAGRHRDDRRQPSLLRTNVFRCSTASTRLVSGAPTRPRSHGRLLTGSSSSRRLTATSRTIQLRCRVWSRSRARRVSRSARATSTAGQSWAGGARGSCSAGLARCMPVSFSGYRSGT